LVQFVLAACSASLERYAQACGSWRLFADGWPCAVQNVKRSTSNIDQEMALGTER